MNIELVKSQNGSNQDVLVVFATQTKKGGETTTKIMNPELQKRLASALTEKAVTGKAKETVLFREFEHEGFRHLIVVGLGGSSDLAPHEQIRQSAAALQKTLAGGSFSSAYVDVDGIPSLNKESLQGFVEGLILASYKFDELKSKKSNGKEDKELQIRLMTKKASDATLKKALEEGSIMAETVNFSRRLGDMPGNLMTPAILADSVVDACKGTKVKVTVWNKARIQKERMGGLYGVAQGSHQEPRFIIMEYKGAAASKKPVVFVGKGLTFDTGGISLKPGAAMEEMKYDMCGGANVIGALLAISKLKLKVNAVGLIPATENMPGGAATKPGDVHTARNGVTFEVNNTDAEGRLILSDALCYGSELEPQMMVDAATLTGAMVVALGNTHTGYFTRDPKLKAKIEKAAQASGEWVWNMPLCDFHAEDMKGTFADLSNISSAKGAGSATAAAFLEKFVSPGIPWAHFDIAGTAWSVGNRLNYSTPKGASGAMVRTFVQLARQFE